MLTHFVLRPDVQLKRTSTRPTSPASGCICLPRTGRLSPAYFKVRFVRRPLDPPIQGRIDDYYCSWGCWVADGGPRYEHDYPSHQRARDSQYARGWNDAWRSPPPPPPAMMPARIWKGLVLFRHPDKWHGQPALLTLADEATRWLLEQRPVERA